MSKIIITDAETGKALDWIQRKDVLSDKHYKSLPSTVETFDFTAFGDKQFSEHLGNRNRVVIPDEDGKFVEFIISEVGKYRDSDGILYVDVFTESSYIALKKAKIISPQRTEALSAESHARNFLAGTDWEVGDIAFEGVRTLVIDKHRNPYELLRTLASTFDLELHFRVDIDHNRVSRRYVDLVRKNPTWRGRVVEFGRDLASIKRVEKTEDIVTALVGVGPEREDGTRPEVFVEDRDALARWGENGQHLVGVYEPQSSDQEMTEDRLRTLTENELEKRVNATVEYESDINDLEYVPGLETKKIRFGDTVKVKDTKFNPPLYLEARVHTLERSIFDQSIKKVTLGDYIEYTESEINQAWANLQAEIRRRLAYMVLASVEASSSTTFKNGEGSTELYAKTILSGNETDRDGTIYRYEWNKRNMAGEVVRYYEGSQKSITVDASEIDEAALFTVNIYKDDSFLAFSQETVTVVYDGEKGAQGVQGPPGEDGQALYTWIKFADDAEGNGISESPTGKAYMGISYNNESPTESLNPAEYQWTKVVGPKGDQGIQGPDGADGEPRYTWVKYADDAQGNGMSDDPTGKEYIGLSYNKASQTESSNVADYTFAKIKGDPGPQGDRGIQGPKGDDGLNSYTHIAYADTSTGSGFSQSPSGKEYIGMYTDHTASDSTDPADYNWSLIKGADGAQGVPGPKGDDGRTPYFHTAWANNSTGTSGFSTTVSDGKLYIGTYTDFTSADSNDPSLYNWTKIKGEQGPQGPQGDTGPQGPNIVDSTTQIEANVINSNHINVSNLSAITANLGTITAGDIRGVDIEARNFNAKSGDFTLEDEKTGVKRIIRENSNLLSDHSFELIPQGSVITHVSDNGSVWGVDASGMGLSPAFGDWDNTDPANARIFYSESDALFGRKCAVLRGQDYGMWDQNIWFPAEVRSSKALTLSASVAAFELTTYDVTASIRLQAMREDGSWLTDLASSDFIIRANEKYEWKTISTTFTGDLPTEAFNLQVRLLLNNNNSNAFALVDGVQLVPYQNPSLYYPESQVYKLMSGYEIADHVVTNGLRVTGDRNSSALFQGKTTFHEDIDRHAHAFFDLYNGWVNYGGGFQPARYTRTATGVVYLSGLIKDGLVGSYTACILPVGCRPLHIEMFSTATSGGDTRSSLVYVYPSGNVRVIAADSNGFVSLSGICFLGEN